MAEENPLDTSSSVHFAPFVVFTWGTPGLPSFREAYVRWDERIVVGGAWGDAGFNAAPELTVETDKHHGGVQDVPYTVQIYRGRPPFDKLCRPFAHATVTVEILEGDPWNAGATLRSVWRGKIIRTSRNARGMTGIAKAQCVGVKERLVFPMGVPCLGKCVWTLGDRGCRVDMAPHTFTGVCSLVEGYEAVIAVPAPPSANYYQWGEAHLDGLSLLVAEQVAADRFRFERLPPPEWATQLITMRAGCDKRLDGDCRVKFNNEARHMALGIKMPDHHPLYEIGNA